MPKVVAPADNLHVTLDVTRLLSRARRATPSGIDRVLFEYLRHLVERGRRSGFLAFVDGVPRSLPRWFAVLLLAHLQRRWVGRQVGNLERLASFAGAILFGRKLRSSLSQRLLGAPWRAHRTVLLNLSHRDLLRLPALRTESTRVALMIHDLMPITRPADFQTDLVNEFSQGIDRALAVADLVLANSAATAMELDAYLQRNRTPSPCLRVAPLATRVTRAASAVSASAAAQQQGARAYFVAMGGVGSRKNVSFLLDVWRSLAGDGSHGDRLPRLVLVCNEGTLAAQHASRDLGELVEVRDGLKDVEVAALLRNARALLMPSSAEGFGLPLLEALAAGVPALCSKLPALVELGGGVPEYLAPLDRAAWVAMVEMYACDDRARNAQLERLACFSVLRWEDHFELVWPLLEALNSPGSRTEAQPARAVP